ncbi:MAG: ATP-binding cassette domain-containing protein, partial [Rhodobacteraceae bacterium]|nr:ATP-binding cassette domain-containing protein [Paracoccaceae bacterium]
PPDRADLAAAEDALRQVGLEGLGARRPGALSGGQQSRAALARVLLRDRPVLLLDEPFAALGPALRAEMLALVAKLRAEHGMTLLMVTHAPQDARLIADSVIFVDGGRAQAPRPVAGVLDTPSPEVAAYLGEAGLA